MNDKAELSITQAARIDLISLESPFRAEPPSESLAAAVSPLAPPPAEEQEIFTKTFEGVWVSLGVNSTRGWAESPPSDVAEQLEVLGFKTSASDLNQHGMFVLHTGVILNDERGIAFQQTAPTNIWHYCTALLTRRIY